MSGNRFSSAEGSRDTMGLSPADMTLPQTEQQVLALVEMMQDKTLPGEVRLRAAELILEGGHGPVTVQDEL